jgi:transposase-like protein
MAPKKLTEADKTSILSLYRQPQETTSTLAERYGVSNSTISRLLKASLPEAEYGRLIQQKRSSTDKTVVPPALPQEEAPAKAKPRSKKKVDSQPEAPPVVEPDSEPRVAELAPDPDATETAASSTKPTRKRRSRAGEVPTAAEPAPESTQLVLPEPLQAEEGESKEAKRRG